MSKTKKYSDILHSPVADSEQGNFVTGWLQELKTLPLNDVHLHGTSTWGQSMSVLK